MKNAGECRRLYNATQTLTDSVCVVVLNPFVSIARIGLYNYIHVHVYYHMVKCCVNINWKKNHTLECMHLTYIWKKESTYIYGTFTCTELILKNYLERFVLLCLKQYMYIYIHVCICVCNVGVHYPVFL